jgi:hypothetical protein
MADVVPSYKVFRFPVEIISHCVCHIAAPL